MDVQRIRILHVLCSDRYSGAENVACQIIRMFYDKDNYEMAYCSPDGPIREALSERSIQFIPMKMATPGEVWRAIKKFRPTVIHAHDMRATLLVALTCGKIPYISHVHGKKPDSDKITFKMMLYCIAARKAKHIFWVSESAFRSYRFRDKLRRQSEILYNIIDAEQLKEQLRQAKCTDNYDIVFVGRLTEPKNPCRLVDVLERVVAFNSQIRIAIIGTGDMEEQVKTLVKQKGLDNHISCLGFMNNPYGILKKAKVMIMTSLWEGTPMVALEAMALGIPIVSTPVDGMCDLVITGETGYLSNDDNELAEYCCRICNDPDLYTKMSHATEVRASQIMNLAAYRKSVENAYDNCINK